MTKKLNQIVIKAIKESETLNALPIPTAGILMLILKAKENGDLWADCALAELNILVGKNYQFKRLIKCGMLSHTIAYAIDDVK